MQTARMIVVEGRPADDQQFHNWQFNVQRELPGSALIEIAYVGSRGIRLINTPGSPTEELNQLNPSFFSQGAALTQLVDNPFFGVLSGPLSGRTIPRQQLLRPYPQYTGVSRLNPAYGNSIYHSVQMRLEKRLAHGLTGLISYTIAKNLTDLTQAQNAFDRRTERAVGDYGVPQRLTIAGAWDLPIGKKRRFLGDAPKALDLLVGGWQLSTFQTYQAGFGLGFGVSGYTGPIGIGPVRPNVVGDPTAGISGDHESRLNRYFNTSAFALPANFTLGNLAARTHTVRSPGMNNVNLTLSNPTVATLGTQKTATLTIQGSGAHGALQFSERSRGTLTSG